MSHTPSPTTNIIGDILDPPVSTGDLDVIYHLAAVVGIEASFKDIQKTYSVNVCGTLRLLQSFKGLFVFVSTVGVYEPLRTPYSLSKYVCEEIVRNASCKHIILRLANPYGVGSRSVVQKWLRTEHIQICGDGNQTRDFIYIDDVIHVLVNARRLQLNKTYNVGTGVFTTLNELAELIAKLSGKRTIERLPTKKSEIYESTARPDITCRTTLEEGLLKCLKAIAT